MKINDTDGTMTALVVIRPGEPIPVGAVVLDEDNPHVCLVPGTEESGMRCPACEMKRIYAPEEM